MSLSLSPSQIIRSLCHPLEPQPTATPPRLDSLHGISVILFDVYGTLLISETGDIGPAAGSDRREAHAKTALAACGLPSDTDTARAVTAALPREIAAAHNAARARGADQPEVDIRDIWRRALAPLEAAPQQIEALALRFECRQNRVWPMPGLEAMLRELQSRGFALGILSNAQFYTPLILETFLGRALRAAGFSPDLLFWSFEHGLAKPSRQWLDRVAQTVLPLAEDNPPRVLMVGNSVRKDIEPAAGVGFRTALFAGDRRSLDETGKARPDAVLTQLDQLPNALR